MENPTRLSLLLFLLSSAALAEQTVTQTMVLVSATSGYSTVTGATATSALGQAGAESTDVGVPIGGVGSTDTDNVADSGTDQGSYSLSTGAVVGICVGIGVLIVGISVVWFLWFLSKKRGWEVRKSIRRASRRVTVRFDQARSRRNSTVKGTRLESRSPPQSRDRDLEKGTAGVKVKTVGMIAPPDAKKDRRTAMIVPPADSSRGARAQAATQLPPSSIGDTKNDPDASPMATPRSFLERFQQRPSKQ